MRIIGIDPGTATTGYGLLKLSTKGETDLLDFGWIKTKKDSDPERRLDEIYKNMQELLDKYSPDVMAIERLFFYSNVKTAMRVGQACGVIMLAAAQANVPIFEYTPGQVKLLIGGNGKADKSVMKKAIRDMFQVQAPDKKKTHFDDVCDAIAIAVCHAIQITNPEAPKSKKSRKSNGIHVKAS